METSLLQRRRAIPFDPVKALVERTDSGTHARAASVEPALLQGGLSAERWLLQGRDPVDGTTGFEIEILRIPPDRHDARTILVTPPVGGGTLLDERLLRLLAESGCAPLLLRRWSGHLEADLDPGTHDRGSLRGVAAIRQTLSHFGIRRAGIFGTSLGGIIASTAAGIDSRIDALVLSVAGGNPVETVLRSDQEILTRLRADRIRSYGLGNMQEYEHLLRRNIRLNPCQFTRPELSSRTWMLIATRDLCVPTATQEELWNHWGRPRRTDLRAGHYWGALAAYLIHGRDIARFLSRPR